MPSKHVTSHLVERYTKVITGLDMTGEPQGCKQIGRVYLGRIFTPLGTHLQWFKHTLEGQQPCGGGVTFGIYPMHQLPAAQRCHCSPQSGSSQSPAPTRSPAAAALSKTGLCVSCRLTADVLLAWAGLLSAGHHVAEFA